MDYKLAKQLKDAGFPQKPTKLNKYPLYCAEMSMPWKYGVNKTPEGTSEYSKIPTLSELIEACGKETLVLWQYNKNWFAGLRRIMNSKGKVLTDTHTLIIDYEDYEIGESKDIAVAKLYLKLNKK